MGWELPDEFAMLRRLLEARMGNLDAALRVNMRLEISEMHVKLKTTMIYVTHDQVEAMTMAGRLSRQALRGRTLPRLGHHRRRRHRV